MKKVECLYLPSNIPLPYMQYDSWQARSTPDCGSKDDASDGGAERRTTPADACTRAPECIRPCTGLPPLLHVRPEPATATLAVVRDVLARLTEGSPTGAAVSRSITGTVGIPSTAATRTASAVATTTTTTARSIGINFVSTTVATACLIGISQAIKIPNRSTGSSHPWRVRRRVLIQNLDDVARSQHHFPGT